MTQHCMNTVKKLHARFIVMGVLNHLPSPLVAHVLSSYASSTSHLDDACRLLDGVHQPRLLIWNSIIRECSQSQRPANAFLFFHRMCLAGCNHSHLTFIFLLKACQRTLNLLAGRGVHSHIVKRGFEAYLFVANALLHMYAFSGGLNFACQMFDWMTERDLVSWNSLICGYAHNGQMERVLQLFRAMQVQNIVADTVTMVKVVMACSFVGDSASVDEVTNYIEVNRVRVDTYLGNSLIDLYGRRGYVDSAKSVFDCMLGRNLVTYNTMLMSYVRAQNLGAARCLFDEMPQRNVVSWTSLISGYSQGRQFVCALKLFSEMMRAKVKPDKMTLATVLSVCAHLGDLHLGKKIHAYIREHNIEVDIYVGNSLVDMYCKCGCFSKALQVFDKLKEKDTVTWNSLIMGLAVNGLAEDALKFFSQMLCAGVKICDITFIAVLLACSHNGLVEKGFQYFRSMIEVHQIKPNMKHYGCLVDLLGRFGYLDHAYRLISNIQIRPDPVLWRSLLSSCKQYNNLLLAEVVTKRLVELDPENSGNYILMSNAYASLDRWDDAMKLRNMIEGNNVQKLHGFSSLELTSMIQEKLVS